MNYSGVMLVDTMSEVWFDEDNKEVDMFTADAEAASVVHLMPVQVRWGSRTQPTHPKLHRAAEGVRFILDNRFPEAYWASRHKEAVLVLGEYKSPNWIEIASVIDIDEGYQFSWQ